MPEWAWVFFGIGVLIWFEIDGVGTKLRTLNKTAERIELLMSEAVAEIHRERSK